MTTTDVQPAASFPVLSIVDQLQRTIDQSQKTRLVAEWKMIDGKLVREWVMK